MPDPPTHPHRPWTPTEPVARHDMQVEIRDPPSTCGPRRPILRALPVLCSRGWRARRSILGGLFRRSGREIQTSRVFSNTSLYQAAARTAIEPRLSTRPYCLGDLARELIVSSLTASVGVHLSTITWHQHGPPLNLISSLSLVPGARCSAQPARAPRRSTGRGREEGMGLRKYRGQASTPAWISLGEPAQVFAHLRPSPPGQCRPARPRARDAAAALAADAALHRWASHRCGRRAGGRADGCPERDRWTGGREDCKTLLEGPRPGAAPRGPAVLGGGGCGAPFRGAALRRYHSTRTDCR
eukprot:scaffold603_cov404-Prasinococcus_capsulatus_cf.AAC.41